MNSHFSNRNGCASRTRRAFALAELLFVAALSSVLLGLLLPAIQKARMTDARKRCENNLKQIGLAMQGYADANDGVLPNNTLIQPVIGSDPPANNVVSPYGSWNTLILPYLGEEKLYRSIDLRYDWFDAADSTNQKAASTRVPTFICPASPNPNRVVRTNDGAGKEFAAGVTDYCGATAAYFKDTRLASLHAGAMNYRYGTYRIRVSDVADGTANTLIALEMGDKPNAWRNGKQLTDNSEKVFDAAGMGLGHGQWAAPNWNHLRSYSFDGTSAFGECAVNCNNGASIYGFHPGGANVTFVDGSVRFLSQARTSQALMVALISIDGGEPLSPDDY